ncbi:MAG: PAS domain S-box protein [Desulfobacteraceae bacterium]|nr:PAS domain S-box protein [Desulfobacteraceae bacterium]
MKKLTELISGSSLRTKSIAACFIVQAIMLSVLIYSNFQVMKNSLNEQFNLHIEEDIRLYKAALINSMAAMDLSALQSIVENIVQSERILYLIVVDPYDQTLVSTGWPAGKKLPPPDNILVPLRHTDKVLNLRFPINIAKQELGYLYLGFDLVFYFVAKQKMLIRGISIAFIEIIATFFVIALIMFFMTRRLEILASASREISKGDLATRVFIDGKDEIAQLATDFNQMALAIEQHVKKITEEKIKSKIYFDVAAVMMLAINSKQQVTMINKKGCEILGYNENEIIGKNWSDHFVPEHFRRDVKTVISKLIVGNTRIEKHYETPILTKKGEERLIVWRNNYITDDSGAIVSIIASGDDITEAKQAEKDLKVVNKQLLHAEKLSAVGSLAASIAHEFNNPLQGIMGIIKGVARRNDLGKEDQELMTMATDECNRMRDLIKNLQDFNRPSSGKITSVDIHTTINTLLVLIRKEYESKDIIVMTNLSENMPLIEVVADQIKQVLLNLLNNAIYACDNSGIITIETEAHEKEVCIKIHDTGSGIKSENLGHIFEPFFTTKPELKGTGLGLSISYGIIKKHKGKIVVDSELGEGTTFTIKLPNEGGINV